MAVRRLTNARVLWLNERWLIESGEEPFGPVSRESYAERFLEDFGVLACDTQVGVGEPATRGAVSRSAFDAAAIFEGNAPGSGGGAAQYLMADRYGGTDGAVHGGSGRSAAKGGFIAKGIGKTPLVSPTADHFHSNGLMSLAEAVKEALCAELVCQELPWGAVPVLAIIDAGFVFPQHHFQDDDKREMRRAAIVVRPAFLRPAHFQRSIYFGTSGHADSDQFKDGLRVRSAVQAFANGCAGFPTLTEMFLRFAQQIGASRALRLCQGAFITSNVSADGGLVDFGSFRSMPDWRTIVGLRGESFGQELAYLRRAFVSVSSYFAKFAPQSLAGVDLRRFLQELDAAEAAQFHITCATGFGASDTPNDGEAKQLGEILDAYCAHQHSRRATFDSKDSFSWLYDAFVEREPYFLAPRREKELALAISALVRRSDRSESGMSARKARQFLEPRDRLTYIALDVDTRQLEERFLAADGATDNLVGEYIDRKLQESALYSMLIPARLELIAVTSNIYSFVALCETRSEKTRVFWVQGARRDTNVYILGCTVPLSDITAPVTKPGGLSVAFEIPWHCCDARGLRIGAHVIRLNVQRMRNRTVEG